METPVFANSFNVISGNPTEFILTFRFEEPGNKGEKVITPVFRAALSRSGMLALVNLIGNALKGTEGKNPEAFRDRA